MVVRPKSTTFKSNVATATIVAQKILWWIYSESLNPKGRLVMGPPAASCWTCRGNGRDCDMSWKRPRLLLKYPKLVLSAILKQKGCTGDLAGHRVPRQLPASGDVAPSWPLQWRPANLACALVRPSCHNSCRWADRIANCISLWTGNMSSSLKSCSLLVFVNSIHAFLDAV